MRIVPLLVAALALPACIIVPPQNVCVVPTPAASGVNTGTTGSPAPGGSASPAPAVPASPAPAVVASGGLVVNPPALSLNAFGPAATPIQAGAGATFRAGNPAIATVDATGTVTGVANGTTTITVTANGQSARVAVTVQQQATTLRVTTSLPGDPRSLPLVAGTPIQLSATATDANGNPIAGVTFRFDPDAGTSATAVTLDANGVTLPAPVLTPIAGTIRAVTPGGQVSTDGDSIRVTAGL